MAKRGRKKKKHTEEYEAPIANRIIGFILLIGSVLGLLSKVCGPLGNGIASLNLLLFGPYYVISLILILLLGLYLIINNEYPKYALIRIIGVVLLIINILVLTHIKEVGANNADLSVMMKSVIDNFVNNIKASSITKSDMGLLGILFGTLSFKLLSKVGSYIVSIAFILLSLFLIFNKEVLKVFDKDKQEKEDKKEEIVEEPEEEESKFNLFNLFKRKDEEEDEEEELIKDKDHTIESYDELKQLAELEPEIVKSPREVKIKEEDLDTKEERQNNYYVLPTSSILSSIKDKYRPDPKVIEETKRKLVEVLSDFNIEAQVVNYTVGPAVTQYELKLKKGTKVNRVLSLNKEISLALAKKEVRIEAPIPGKETVGIELANDAISTVGFKEVFDDINWSNNKLEVVLGRNIMNRPISIDIDKMPHLLVAGSTGSGKSVCINCIIASILMRAKPSEVKLVLIDPKKVEFTMYEDLPHLLTPIVNEPKKASVALKQIVAEMDKRYTLFSNTGVKNITGYNEYIEKHKDKGLERLPFIICIIDELADLMVVAAKEVEDSIMRITQLARAAGIHLIVATQRPSTDVITGVVKANIPSRISFAVSSQIDSRTILDMPGAEKLLGRGDMLYLPLGENSPERIQGAFIKDDDIESLCKYIKKMEKPDYDTSFDNMDASSIGGAGSDDETYNEIEKYAIEAGQISISKIQRKFNMGFNKAADYMDQLEENGIVEASTGSSKPRKVIKPGINNE